MYPRIFYIHCLGESVVILGKIDFFIGHIWKQGRSKIFLEGGKKNGLRGQSIAIFLILRGGGTMMGFKGSWGVV